MLCWWRDGGDSSRRFGIESRCASVVVICVIGPVSYLRGLLGSVKRKNSWQLAEHLGNATPHGIQRLLDRARWDADAVRDEMIRYAGEHLLANDEGGVLIVDETGFLKKGDKSVDVQRQYSGTAGRIENCQIGVFLGLVGSRGRTSIDRALYLPTSWCQDADRRREARVPKEVAFATKPKLAMGMLEHALATGLKPRWVLADEVYGSDSKFRQFLETKGQPYVLAVTSQQRLWVDLRQRRVDVIAADVPNENWFRFSIAEGSKGPRVYDWTAGKLGIPHRARVDPMACWCVEVSKTRHNEPTICAWPHPSRPGKTWRSRRAIAGASRAASKPLTRNSHQVAGC